jgi:hypothetical protein
MARKQESEPSVPEAARPAYDAIVALTDTFCQAHLTWEYQMLYRLLEGKVPHGFRDRRRQEIMTEQELHGHNRNRSQGFRHPLV